MTEILLVEDDPALGRGLLVNLELEGYRVRWARSLDGAKETFRAERPDLVVLDLGLPDGSGLELLEELRSTDPSLPVLILTARADEDSVVEGLQAGASDYVRKPFGNRELLARIRIALREPRALDGRIRYQGLLLLPEQRKALYEGRDLELSRREFDLLAHLASRAEAVVSREALLQATGTETDVFDRTVDSHVSHIRARLRKAGISSLRISSVYGVGYRLEAA